MVPLDDQKTLYNITENAQLQADGAKIVISFADLVN